MLRFVLSFKHWFLFLTFFLMLGYLGFHFVEGDLGLRSWQRLERERRAVSDHLVAAQQEVQTLERRVGLLKGHIDRDLLEEQVFRHLGYVRPGDLVFFDEPSA